MLKQLNNITTQNNILLALITFITVITFPLQVLADKVNIGVYITIPTATSSGDAPALNRANQMINAGLRRLLTLGDIVANVQKIPVNSLANRSEVEMMDLDEILFEEWLQKSQRLTDFVKEHDIGYILAGKYEPLGSGIYSTSWNIVKVELTGSKKFDANSMHPSQDLINISNILKNDHSAINTLVNEVLMYVQKRYPKLMHNNVVFCSCFGINNSMVADSSLTDVSNILPGILVKMLDKKMKDRGLQFKNHTDLKDKIKNKDCDELTKSELRSAATEVVAPDYYIWGVINMLGEQEIKVDAFIDNPKSSQSSTYDDLHTETYRAEDVGALAEDTALIIKNKWDAITKKLKN